MLETLERDREVRTALRSGNGVDLVDDDRAQRAEHPASTKSREQDVQRLGRRDEDVRRRAHHPRARRRGRVTGTHADSNLGEVDVGSAEPIAQLRQRPFEISLDVVVQRLERRDVEQMNRVRERAFEPGGDERVELPQECGERLSRARRGEDERVLPTRDRGPSFALRRARRT